MWVVRKCSIRMLILAACVALISLDACRAQSPAAAQSPSQLAEQIGLDAPGDREFILDTVDLIQPADADEIRRISEQLLTDKAAPIVVVTIDSMASYGAGNLRIETFARLLFDQWGIGPVEVQDTPWNYGMLLLVSRDDRKARIELGAGWRRDKDVAAQRIMDELIIPQFRNGDYSTGILAGVQGMDKLARDLKLPSRPVSTRAKLMGAAVIGLVIFTVVSLIRRGSSGWAWLFWGATFAVLGTVLYHMSRHSGSSSSGGGFSGGSFGGGFSGGGGASGSW